MTFRFATFASVSTDEQAKDKDSLASQVRECRAYAERLGGVESAGPYVADGYSRSGYEGLSEAMQDIPALRDAVEGARSNQYDVLLVRYFDRLGSVGEMVFTHFKKIKKQLRSVQEATPILPPDLYDPLRDDSTMTQIKISGIYQEGRINRIVLNRREMMPKRIQDGLAAGVIPYGYQFVSTKQPAVQIPEKCAKLLEAKQMLFAGAPYTDIAKYLGVSKMHVRNILENPYYAGQVFINKRVQRYIGEKKTRVYTAPSEWTIGAGKHQPLWTVDDWHDIQTETRRRAEVIKKNRPTHPYMGLVKCGECGGALKQRQSYSAKTSGKFLICRTHGLSHVGYPADELFELITAEIQNTIRQIKAGKLEPDEGTNQLSIYEKTITAKQHQRKQIQAGLLADPPAFTAAEAGKLVHEIDVEIEKARTAIERIQQQDSTRRASLRSIQNSEYSGDNFPLLFKRRPAEQVNAFLRGWIKVIEVWNGDRIKVTI